jgi:hypothetical protein
VDTALVFLYCPAEVIRTLLYQIFRNSFFLRHKRLPFTELLVGITALAILNIHCSWTPEIETVLYDSPVCTIALETSHAFKIQPLHPISIQDSLMRKYLEALSIHQEKGMLQQLLITAPPSTPAFSPAQVDFLAPHLSKALANATPEEIVNFKCPGRDEDLSLVQGNLAAFPPFHLLLTLKNRIRSSRMSSKLKNARSLQFPPTLAFSEEGVMVSEKEVQTFMTIPSTSQGIVIDFYPLVPPHIHQESQQGLPDIQNTRKPENGAISETDSLSEQLRDLREKVDQQEKEIRRLRQTLSP